MIDWSRREASIAEGGSDMLYLHNLMGSHNFRNFEPNQDLIASEPEAYVDIETNCIRGIRSSDSLVAYICIQSEAGGLQPHYPIMISI